VTASSLQVTPGSGLRLATNSYTEGAVTVHDQKAILGEQNLASYTVSTAGASTATAGSHLLQIMAGASLAVRIRRIEIWQWAVATTATLMQANIIRLTTAGTGGSVLTVTKNNTGDVAAGFTAMRLPTANGAEAAASNWVGAVYMMQTIGASASMQQPLAVISWDFLRSQSLIIQPGTSNGIAVSNITAVAAGSVVINVWADESSF
jgi:hypothetical protein